MDNQNLMKLIHDLHQKVDSMQKNEFHFHIENVTVEHLQLEELAYHLDKIDIKELSGMMNLGNSFSPNLEAVKSQSKKTKEENDTVRVDPSNCSSEQEKSKKDEPVLSVIINGKELLFE